MIADDAKIMRRVKKGGRLLQRDLEQYGNGVKSGKWYSTPESVVLLNLARVKKE